MADAKQCDICKTFYRPYNDIIGKSDLRNAIRFCKVRTDRQIVNDDIIELCPECLKKIEKFIKCDMVPVISGGHYKFCSDCINKNECNIIIPNYDEKLDIKCIYKEETK